MKRTAIIVVILCFLPGYLRASPCEGGVKLIGKVSDVLTHVGVAGAKVSAVGDDACETVITDDRGRFKLRLVSRIKSGESVRIRAEKTGYEVFDEIEGTSEVPLDILIRPQPLSNKPKPAPKQQQSGKDTAQTGPITQGPGSIAQIGGVGNTATIIGTIPDP